MHLALPRPSRILAVITLAVLAGCSLTLETVRRMDGSPDGSADGANADGNADAGDDAAQDALDTIDARDAPDGLDASDTLDVVDTRDTVDAADAVDAPDIMICASSETCNGRDDTCDGTVDEGFPAVTCGVGACRRSVRGCVAGMIPSCVAGAPSSETCNGVDDDCNGLIDDGIPNTMCGIGACAQSVPACRGASTNICTPGGASPEVCGNRIDDDCDGVVDDGCICNRYVLFNGIGAGLTPADPTGSIQNAINSLSAMGTRGVVCVGALAATGVPGCVRAVYVETIAMTEGISVLGSFRVSGNIWARDPLCVPTTVIAPVSGGLVFGHGITNATQLDGFTINGPTMATSGVGIAVTMQSGGTVSNNVINFGSASLTIGIDIFGSPAPAIGPLISRNMIGGATGGSFVSSGESIGIRARNPAAQIQFNGLISGAFGSASASTGIKIEGGRGTIVSDNQLITGGTSASGVSAGVWVLGDATGVSIARNQSIGGGGPGAESRGVRLEGCTAGRPVVSANSNINGGASSNSAAVYVSTCATTISANDTIVGRTSGSGANARGVSCVGSGSDCDVRFNRRIVGLDAGGSLSQDATAVMFGTSAVGRVVRNPSILGCVSSANSCSGISIFDTLLVPNSPLIEANVIEAHRPTNWGSGIRTVRTNALVANNLVFVDRYNGIEMALGRSGGTTEATVVFNTVVTVMSPATPPAANLLNVDFEGTVVMPPNGVVRNNILACIGPGTNRVSMRESGNSGDPRIFENNDLWNCSVLYFDADGSRSLTTTAAINSLSDITSAANVSLDPLFVTPGTDLHIIARSPLIDLGTAAFSGLTSDFDTEARVTRLAPDIGYDEVP